MQRGSAGRRGQQADWPTEPSTCEKRIKLCSGESAGEETPLFACLWKETYVICIDSKNAIYLFLYFSRHMCSNMQSGLEIPSTGSWPKCEVQTQGLPSVFKITERVLNPSVVIS